VDFILIGLQVVSILGIGCLFVFKKYFFSYSSEKGKNLATREDIEEITRKVEDVKSSYIAEIERLKFDLSRLSRKHDILLDEKIRVFKELQKRLVDFGKYCEAVLGSTGYEGEFHPSLCSLSEDIDRATLRHLSHLSKITQMDFIFLSKKSKNILFDLHVDCSMMCSFEKNFDVNDIDSDHIDSVISMYENAHQKINECLQRLYEELEFPSNEEQR
jgi:hypothetical protein